MEWKKKVVHEVEKEVETERRSLIESPDGELNRERDTDTQSKWEAEQSQNESVCVKDYGWMEREKADVREYGKESEIAKRSTWSWLIKWVQVRRGFTGVRQKHFCSVTFLRPNTACVKATQVVHK